jgi:hypothetical protein
VSEDTFDTAKPAAFQKFRYLAVNGLIEDAKKLTGAVSDKDVSLLKTANLDAELEPEAVAFVLANMKGVLNYEDKNYKDYMAWRKENPRNAYPERDFTLSWHEKPENNLTRFKEEAASNIAFLGQKLPSNPADLVHGQKYRTPKGVGYYDATAKNFFRKQPAPLE